MNQPPNLKTRREFLRDTLLGGALSWTVPAFLANTFSALQAEAADRLTQPATGKDGTILVVLQMAGGNDGINTVVPYASDFYHRARPKLGLAPRAVLKLTDQIGLHPSMKGFKALYDAGHLSIIQGVGYPNPNRSHFRSTEIWQTASDSNRYENSGWLGRYFDNACAGCDPVVGVSVGHRRPQAFSGPSPLGVTIQNPRTYRFFDAGRRQTPNSRFDDQFYRRLNQAGNAAAMKDFPAAGATVGAAAGAAPADADPLDFLERVAMDAQVSSAEIRSASAKSRNQVPYPPSALANSLKLVARLIGGGLPTRVYYVVQGGYDTHTNQIATQARLLGELADNCHAFVRDLKAQGNLDRVLLITFSEFGRRVAENASGGTDHGAAAPLFAVGSRIKPGLLGKYPSLAPRDLFEGDIVFNVDFRSVYAAVLEHWLKTKSRPVLKRTFPPLNLVHLA